MTAGRPSGSIRAEKPALVLLNFGGPRHLEEVPDFLYEILRDPNTIQLPFPQWGQNLLARFIARRRGREVTRQYAAIGGCSPLVAATERIAAVLRQALDSAGRPLPVHVAHRYLPGHAACVVNEILAAGADAILALPLYPQFSYASSGSSFQQLHGLLAGAGWEGRLCAVRSYPDAAGYLEALCESLSDCLARARLQPHDTVILCSAHGLPRGYVERGDPYRLELYRTLEALRQRFDTWRIELSFQSRVGPAEWLRPYTDEIIPSLAEQGARHVVFLPISFVNDHLETLYEVGVTYFDQVRRHGMTPHRVAAIEHHPSHIRMLSDAALRWLDGRAGVPLAELLPPDQSFARRGRWAWGLWLMALLAALLLAVR